MKLFRMFLIIQFLAIAIYTWVVGSTFGWNLLPIFFGDMLSLNWPGQFNFDFLMMLTLSALWTAWRNRFTMTGLGLGSIALVGGIAFLAPYLLYLTFKEKGDIERVLLGKK